MTTPWPPFSGCTRQTFALARASFLCAWAVTLTFTSLTSDDRWTRTTPEDKEPRETKNRASESIGSSNSKLSFSHDGEWDTRAGGEGCALSWAWPNLVHFQSCWSVSAVREGPAWEGTTACELVGGIETSSSDTRQTVIDRWRGLPLRSQGN